MKRNPKLRYWAKTPAIHLKVLNHFTLCGRDITKYQGETFVVTQHDQFNKRVTCKRCLRLLRDMIPGTNPVYGNLIRKS